MAAFVACHREPAARVPATLGIVVDTSNGAHAARIVVTGVDSANLAALQSSNPSTEAWNALLELSVENADSIAVAGQYSVSDGLLTFTPAFPLDRGRSYTVRFAPAQLPTPRSDTALARTITLPLEAATQPTVVARVLPSAPVLPENALRLYVEFSAPMSRRAGVDFIHLIDDGGNEIRNAFLPLDADFWNPDHTRYTVFLDPGRVKRGIRPNEQMGRALRAGRAYALRIDSTWKDAEGRPLAHSYRHEFRVGPAVDTPIDLVDWKVQPPRSSTRAPLVITFPRPLDHGLLQRAIGVRAASGERINGTITIAPGEQELRFAPARAWSAGNYRLIVLPILEDVAGNRVGRAFEVDEFTRVDSAAVGEEHSILFTVR